MRGRHSSKVHRHSRRHGYVVTEGTGRLFSGFSLKYHIELIAREFTRLSLFFLQGKSFVWVLKFIRLLAFTMALLPAFIVFAWYYFISSDRRVFCYANESKKTSRHYIDIYGSMITGSDWETLSLSYHQYSNISSKSTGRTSPSNSLSSDLSDDIDDIDSQNSIRAKGSGKPIVIFLTGGAWTIGYKMWGALLARALVPMGIIVAIPDYRNFPQTMVDGMIDDVDTAIQWVIDNCGTYLIHKIDVLC